jgi:shikimate kinase
MNEGDMREFIAKHLFDRSFYYNQAQYKVCVDDRTIDQTVADIFAVLA